jgi:hypothetical protein
MTGGYIMLHIRDSVQEVAFQLLTYLNNLDRENQRIFVSIPHRFSAICLGGIRNV